MTARRVARSGLHGRVGALERRVDRAAGCRACGGRGFYAYPDDWRRPAWIDDRGRCRGCGETLKAWLRSELDRLP